MSVKISTVIRELNVGRLTIEDFLRKKHIEVDTSNVNARIDDAVYEMLVKEFKPDMEQKIRAKGISGQRQKDRPAPSASRKPEEPKPSAAATPKTEEIKTEVPGQKPRVLGTIDLSHPGSPIVLVDKPEAPAAPKPEAPAAPKPEAPAAPKPEAPAAPEKSDTTDEVFSITHHLEGPKIIGHVNPEDLEPSGRAGKKKSKDGRGSSERKKRKRIGKEKVDITKEQPSENNGDGGGKQIGRAHV